MKSFIVNKDGSTEIKEIPKPRYHSKQALVKTIACGMCGIGLSDYAGARGSWRSSGGGK